MNIDLFQFSGENILLDKTNYLSEKFTLVGELHSDCSVLNPIILVNKSNPTYYRYNYMYIAEFGRYYFITDIIGIRNDLWEIHGHVDVLFSWKPYIQNMRVIVEKTESMNDANLYLDDGTFLADSRKGIETKFFPSGLDDNGTYILIAAGGE